MSMFTLCFLMSSRLVSEKGIYNFKSKYKLNLYLLQRQLCVIMWL